jgi:O-antigen/teichoic acid export membrane protein
MPKTDKRQILQNIGSSWFSFGVNVVIGVFLSPFILHRLGDAAFGIWVLIFSVTGYYGLFDLGIRSSVVRFVSKFSATHDSEGLARVINTSLFAYSGIGVVAMALTVVGALHVDSLFKIPPELHSAAHLIFLIVGASVAVGFPLGVFGGALEGLQRFYLINWTNVGSTLLRAGVIVLALRRGHGLIVLALITTLIPFITSLIRAGIALSILRTPLDVRHIHWSTARMMANHSGLTFMIVVSAQLRFQTDEIVIGTLLSASAITFFSIGARIVDYANNTIHCITQLFVPMSSQSEAKGDAVALRKILVGGNRACAIVILPIAATLIVLGRSIIEVWVGARYVPQSYPILLVLIIPFTLMLAQGASTRMLLGTSQHGTFGAVTLIEGVVNILLSILLIRPYGIFGDALGTAIPMMCTVVLFLPRHACRKFGISVFTMFREAYTLPVLITLPFLVTLLLERRWFVPHRAMQLGLQLVIAVAVYGLGFLWIYKTNQLLRIDDNALLGSEEILPALLQEQM